jgi:MFS family permease
VRHQDEPHADEYSGYFSELRENWRTLTAASLGVGGGLNLFAYAASVMAPHLVKEFGWTRSQFALVGLTMFTTLLILPFVGRLTDIFGVKRMATLGVVLTPASLFCFSLMQGPFYQYLVISTVALAVGSLTTPVVYTRLIVANFHRARGLALTIVTCSPALLGAIGVPLLSDFVDANGWRMGFRVIAVFILLLGCLSVLLIARGRRDEGIRSSAPAAAAGSELQAVYRRILRIPAFWMIAIGMFLCTLQTPLHSSQMNLMLLDNHISTATAARMVSIYATSTIIGRIACGLALDKYPTHLVAALSLSLPAIGYALLASSFDGVPAIGFAMLLIGLSVGAEGDLTSFMVARYFGLEIYSTVMGLVFTAIFLASAVGALTLSLTLKATDSFSLFMGIVSVTILCGSLLLSQLKGSQAGTKPSRRTVSAR